MPGKVWSPAPSWTDDLPVCHLSGIGFSTNQIYRQDGAREEEHEFEDRFFHFRAYEVECYLYGIFDGHDGMHVADFARLRLPAELLLGQLLDVTDDAAVKDILHRAFHTVERSYFETIDEVLAERTNLKLQLPEELNDYELYQQYPTEVDKIQSLDSQIIGGASANIALIISGKLYVANVGDSRTILCISEPDGSLSVKQLSIDHTVLNDDEILRLQQLGLDVSQINGNQLGSSNTTRKIGDHSLKGGYKEHVMLSLAQSEPVIAEPEVIGGIPLNGMNGFMAMFTGGLHKSLVDATATTQVNIDIAKMIAAEFSVQTTLSGVTQGVVDKVVRIHHDTYLEKGPRASKCHKREDITLLVRNFGFPLGTSVSSPMSQFNPVTVPYNPGAVSAQRPTLIIPPRPGFTGPSSPQPSRILQPDQIMPISPTMVPLSINVTDTMSPTSSRTSTVGSPTSSSVSTPCSNLNDTDPNSNQDSRYNTSDSDTQRSGEELLLFQRLQVASPRPTEPDEEGYIEPYVDFTEFNEVFNAAIMDNLLSQ
ncbi:TGF-beta-activated kinase 1 and MAP3K7-binding protein 1-like isoform X2 [Patiria miniata]|uniref:TGF-beta-activated kinase 1 and MAP3K7-binding protein 1 n=1 Tax=Patiria miniata TaxID=46514 RepID=A0A914ALS8_PATMI|nr:TGF-beta-activated kinase 1 and MAP3K7-binding protein 1-like isoform X2 [Patiria miniata]XP_038064384.1 TGF-beta-activated kinase 1 and MAP3K7-binding protein 1-like isoform X2 [Patiria miniata]